MGNRGASNSAERVRRHVNHQRPSDYLREAPIEPFRRRMESLILGLETFPSGKPAWPPLGRRSEGLAAPDKLRRATHPPEAPGPQSHGPNQLPATSSTPNTVMPGGHLSGSAQTQAMGEAVYVRGTGRWKIFWQPADRNWHAYKLVNIRCVWGEKFGLGSFCAGHAGFSLLTRARNAEAPVIIGR